METYYYYRQSVLKTPQYSYSCSFAPAEQFLRDRLKSLVSDSTSVLSPDFKNLLSVFVSVEKVQHHCRHKLSVQC